MAQTQRLQLIRSGMWLKKPRVSFERITWPWLMSAVERTAVANATRGEFFDEEHFGRVLDARIENARAQKTGRKRVQ